MTPNHRPSGPLDGYPDADLSDLPLPPPSPDELAGRTAPVAPEPASRRPAEAAALDFLDPERGRGRHVLAFPFRWEGREVREIAWRRMTVAEFGTVVEGYGEGDPVQLFDFLAVMTGLPAAVLRGLEADDGAEVMLLARPFLPRSARLILFGDQEAETTSTS